MALHKPDTYFQRDKQSLKEEECKTMTACFTFTSYFRFFSSEGKCPKNEKTD